MARMVILALSLAAATAANAEPDFTGVWQLASPPMTSPQGYPDLPFTPEGRERVEAYRALVDPTGENPTQWCVSHGMPEMMMGGGSYPVEVIQKADQVTIIGEAMSETRRVYLGDRIAPDADIFPSRHGYSKGHWEGDVLVVETAHLQELPDSRYPHSAAATITERFQLTQDADGTPHRSPTPRCATPNGWSGRSSTGWNGRRPNPTGSCPMSAGKRTGWTV